MVEEINFIDNLFSDYKNPLLLLGVIFAAIIIIKYIQSISKKLEDIK